VDVAFGKIDLANLAQEIYCPGVRIGARCLVDVQDYPDALDVEIFPRRNISKRITFQANREHVDENEAEHFCNVHDEEILGRKDKLRVSGSFGGWELFYDAACTVCDTRTEGCRTYTDYEFVAGVSAKK
jgi:hypothetical protein